MACSFIATTAGTPLAAAGRLMKLWIVVCGDLLDVSLSEFMSVAVPSQVDRWLATKASMMDLPVDGATVEELEKVKLLRTAILHSLGSSRALEGWEASSLLQATLVRYLCGRRGDIKAAEVMLVDSLEWFREQKYWEDWLQKQEVEDSPQHKALFRKYGPEGPFGLDKLGVPVLYVRAGLQDTVGMMRETSVEVYGTWRTITTSTTTLSLPRTQWQ